ncbi:MAG: helix-turn-helix domain-containing protein, partial [Clostridiales bacterium]
TLKQLIDENTLKKILDREHYDNIYYKNDKQYMVISPIVGQKKLFGFLLIILEDEQFDKKNEAIINHVSLILALEWLRQDEKTKSLSDFSNKFLEELLADSSKGNVSKYADQLGLLPGGYFCLSAFKCDFISNESTSFYVRRIIDIVKYISMKVIVFSRNDEIYIIFNSQEKNDTYLKNIDKIEDDILAINENIVISRGGIYQSVENISRSFHDIQLCKKLIVNYGLFPRKLDYSSLGIWQLLLKLDKEDLRNFAEDILSNLIRENNDKNKELFFTLKTYLANNKNIRASAKILDIHYNTMYFRIKKIEEILGRNLDDEKDLCDVQIAIEIMGQV